MKPEIKKQWIAALTSGEYKQGTGCLRDVNNNYCCLGVLTDLYQKQTGDGYWEQDPARGGFRFNWVEGEDSLSEGSVLPQRVKDWADLDSVNPTVTVRPDIVPEISSLGGYSGSSIFAPPIAEYNDADVSFEGIAAIIEANY